MRPTIAGAWRFVDVNGPDRAEIPDRLRDLIDDCCADHLDEAGLRELEAGLLSSEPARRYFVEYWQMHAELEFSTRARRAASAALSRFDSGPTADDRAPRDRRRGRLRVSRRMMALAGSLLAAAGFALGQWNWWKHRKPADVAWLINAQDCLWAADDADTPGRNMSVGKILRLERGLAEVEFDRGARVILKGPAALELLSDNEARLLSGSMTARVPEPAHGFTVYSPQGKVVDLGTEFGVSVDDPGTTSVRVFSGALTAASGDGKAPAVLLVKDEEALIVEGRPVSHRPAGAAEPGKFTRSIEPPPVIRPRTLKLDFSRPVENTLLDAEGRGIGLTHRLPGTGSALEARDLNLLLNPSAKALELTTTRSDLNRQARVATGEYLGFRLSDLGFIGREDFTISVEIPKIPALDVVGQFGLYAGVSGTSAIRGGVLSQKNKSYSLFLVNNIGGTDQDLHEVGLTNVGEDLRFTLEREKGRYSLLVENLTTGSSSRLSIAHPTFLDQERDLYVGIFGANTQSDVRATLTIKELGLTVFTESPPRSLDPSSPTEVPPNRVPVP
jgi:hypothetical protein